MAGHRSGWPAIQTENRDGPYSGLETEHGLGTAAPAAFDAWTAPDHRPPRQPSTLPQVRGRADDEVQPCQLDLPVAKNLMVLRAPEPDGATQSETEAWWSTLARIRVQGLRDQDSNLEPTG